MNFDDVINACSLTSEKAQDAEISELTNFLHASLGEDNKPAAALAGFPLNHSDCWELVSSFTGTEIPSELKVMTEGQPSCIIFDYSDKPGFINSSETGDTIIYGLPSEKLKAQRVAIIDSVTSAERWLELSRNLDAICLCVNATMAMNQSERVWLEGFAQNAYSDGNLYIALTKVNSLNTEEEAEQVHDTVSGFLRRHNIKAQILTEPEQAMNIMQDFLSKHDAKEIHGRRVSLVVLKAITERARRFVDEVLADDESIAGALRQLDKQKRSLELSGKAAADGVLSSLMNGLMAEVCDGVRDYGRQMAGSINSYIAKASMEKLEDIDDKINSYINGTWEEYFTRKGSEIDKKFSDIAARLTDQMDIDAGELIAGLDEQARRTIYAALNLEAPLVIEGISSDAKHNPSTVSVSEITDNLRRETRNMMMLSIPLLFVNPMMSAGNLVAAKLIEKFRMSGKLEEVRSELKGQVEDVCFANAENIVRQIQQSFRDETARASENVRSAYTGLVSRIEDDIARLKAESGRRAEARAFLLKQLNETYPALEAELISGRQ